MPTWGKYKETSEYNKLLHVFPNPAGNYFIAYYNLMEEMKQLTLIVTGANGKIIHLLKLQDKENQVVISMNDYSAGIYLVNLYSESKLLGSSKVIITK